MAGRGRATFSIFATVDCDEDSLPVNEVDRRLMSHGSFVGSFPWQTSAVGPREEWSAVLSTYYSMVMAAPFPAMLCYGPDLIMLYNAEFGRTVGLDDSIYFGQAFSEVWSESDLSVELFEGITTCMTTGTAVVKQNLLNFVSYLNPDGDQQYYSGPSKRETYFTWTMTPISEADGTVAGAFVTARETTDAVLYERRMQVLKELYDATGSAEILPVLFTQSVSVLRKHCAEDIALFGLYTCDTTNDKVLRYRCGFGLLQNPEKITFDPNPALFEQAILDTSSSAVYITAKADGFRNYIEYDPTRGWSDEIRELIFLPAMRDNNVVVGVAVIGLNPRRDFDEPYELFLELLGRQLATGIDSLRHIEETSDKLSWEVAVSLRKREELEGLLMEKTKQLKISEGRFSRMAKILPAGIFLASAEGEIIYANEAWYKLSHLPKENNPSFWIKSVHPGDRSLVRDSWRRAMQGKEERIEFRWARRRGEATTVERWCDSAVSAEVDPDTGKITHLTGVWSDITERKQAEALQRQRADDAVERRRQQEYFIDAISHEMRNPLSAIIQSVDVVSEKVDSVALNLKEIQVEQDKLAEPVKELEESSDCLDTIQLCTSHMRRIITDTINLSKMESGLFPINPENCQPLEVAKEVMKMYENELKSLSITHSIEVGDNFRALGIDVVKMDPRRISQILINLVSNAMKVLTASDRKHITVKLDASLSKPILQFHNHTSFYVPQSRHSAANFANAIATSPTKSVLASKSPRVAFKSSASTTSLQTSASTMGMPTTASVASSAIPSTSAPPATLNGSTVSRTTSYAALAAALSSSPSSVAVNAPETAVQNEKNTVYIMYVVKDTGSGMDPEQLATAFQRFTSHFTPRTHVNYGGSGLGLFICRKLVETQGGEITAESKTNEGSEFTFYIKTKRVTGSSAPSGVASPVSSPVAPLSPVTSHPMRMTSVTASSTVEPTQRPEKKAPMKIVNPHIGKKILIVEDNLINQKLLQRQLQNAGFVTLIANHGQEALDLVCSGHNPDCCVMDCEMPVMDGVEAVQKIRELESRGDAKAPRLPIIALSANARQVHVDRMAAAGSDRYLTKPFSFTHLIDVVTELLTSDSQGNTNKSQ
ncbi:hypothetical protein POJ06DRAFT_245589 [Lipomyces tetrasporus]|uniref:histidine kinase n=1 Tax=Lipomyces tetrasporus TaxID=54092 RepID=A0AAD7VUS7_9ASCO|nr:uncharacterized protein POJ06DRAFT_245589 [Lipomyces tetrasporus]KAJ8102773.1 hypothetical protein POJ06DRAFT_245589 [Lipomyces tetrasporus]